MIKLVKIVFGVGLCLIIFFQVEKSISKITDFNELQIQPFYLFISILLMPLNWSLEAVKWKLILKPQAHISFKKSLMSIFSGVFVGMFTPARVGEYGGRMIPIHENLRLPSMAATFYGSLAQNSIHVLGGIGLGGLFIMRLIPNLSREIPVFPILSLLFVLVLVLYYLFPFVWVKLLPFIQKYTRFSWLKNFFFLRHITILLASLILTLSALRYGIYFMQYLFILKSFNIPVPMGGLSPGIASIFLLQSWLPLPPVLNFLGRGEISILVWEQIGIAAPIALSAAVLLWFINLVIPAIAGYILVVMVKVKT